MHAQPIQSTIRNSTVVIALAIVCALPIFTVGGCVTVVAIMSLVAPGKESPQRLEDNRIQAALKAAPVLAQAKVKKLLGLSDNATFTHPTVGNPIRDEFMVVGYVLEGGKSHKYVFLLKDNGTTTPTLDACMIDGEIVWDASRSPSTIVPLPK